LPGGLADPSGQTGFFANARGGIDAVDLATGDLLWETAEAQRPLLVVGDRLYAQAGVRRNRLRVLAFDLTRRGECLLESDPVVFPGWVVTAEAPGRSFTARWRLERNQLVLAWEARAWSGGSGRLPEVGLAPRKRAAGLARIDLDTGQVETGPAEHAPPAPPIQAPRHLERLAVRWQGVVGPTYTALVLEEVRRAESTPQGPGVIGREQRLVLLTWDRASQIPYPPRELLRGNRLLVQPTVDGKLLCLRDTLPRPDEMVASQARTSVWSIFAPTGRLVARVPYEPGTEAIAVLGPRAYYLVASPVRGPLDRPTVRPRRVQAVELETGKKLWERALAGKTLVPPQ
jgi:hypothetical protein